MGWSREELIGMHPSEFDAGLDEPSIRRLTQRADAGEMVTFETRHRRKDGTAFPVEIRTGTFSQGGELFYLALARDISERKQAEERTAKLAAIVESSDDAIISKRSERHHHDLEHQRAADLRLRGAGDHRPVGHDSHAAGSPR